MSGLAYQAESKWNTWYKWGAVALLWEGLAYLIILVTSPMIGPAPANSLQYLNALAAHPGIANFTYVVIATADLAFIPVAVLLYRTLRSVNKTWMTTAAAILLVYVVVDITTFIVPAIYLVSLSQQAQTASVLAAENTALAMVPFSQFFGWVVPPIAFVFCILTLREAHLGLFARVFGFFTVIFSFAGSISFIDPNFTNLQNYQLPAIACYGIFFLGFGITVLKLRTTKVFVEPVVQR
jgi:hypothetical protein